MSFFKKKKLSSLATAVRQIAVYQDEKLEEDYQMEVMWTNSRWTECLHVYSKAMEQDVALSLTTLMVGASKVARTTVLWLQNGMLRPDDIQEIKSLARRNKVGSKLLLIWLVLRVIFNVHVQERKCLQMKIIDKLI